jgi:osmotically-inducible protein OsmY
MKAILPVMLLILAVTFAGGCSRKFVGGAAVGAGGAGAAYEYSNKRQMDSLEEDRKSGKITQEEYDRRKKEIEGRSLVY